MKKVDIAPSILGLSLENFEPTINLLFDSGARYLHFDVMDGKFVPNTSFSASDLGKINLEHKLINDVHLMVFDPINYVDDYAKFNADIITIHFEAFNKKEDLLKTISCIKEKNIKVGLSIKPKTEVNEIKEYLSIVDLVLVMSVEPGFGGQSFMMDSLKKIRDLQGFKEKLGLNYLIEVDGGINKETGKLAKEAGADILVAGSFIFKNDIKTSIEALK